MRHRSPIRALLPVRMYMREQRRTSLEVSVGCMFSTSDNYETLVEAEGSPFFFAPALQKTEFECLWFHSCHLHARAEELTQTMLRSLGHPKRTRCSCHRSHVSKNGEMYVYRRCDELDWLPSEAAEAQLTEADSRIS